MSDGISDDVKKLIIDRIDSVEQLEILLLLQRTAPREWSAAAVAKELYVSAEASAARLEEFHEAGLVARRKENEDLYRYSPPSGVDRIVQMLAADYESRRVRIINLIFSKPLDKIRSFSDAFKFKRDED